MAPRLHSGSIVATEIAQFSALVDRTRLFVISAPALSDTVSVHAAFAGNSAASEFPGPVTNPATPRNLQVEMGPGWDGGDVTVVGTRLGSEQTETFATGSGVTRVGTKVFDTVASASKAAVGASAATASIGVGNKLGIPEPMADAVSAILYVDNAAEPGIIDLGQAAFTPTVTLPDGVAVYALLANI